jgi:membrane protein insertase Oxa1/YidC/SpoIIIJ
MGEGMAVSPQMRWFFRGMSGLTLFVTLDFPVLVLLYFATSNTASIVQTAALRTPVIRDALGIPAKVRRQRSLAHINVHARLFVRLLVYYSCRACLSV